MNFLVLILWILLHIFFFFLAGEFLYFERSNTHNFHLIIFLSALYETIRFLPSIIVIFVTGLIFKRDDIAAILSVIVIILITSFSYIGYTDLTRDGIVYVKGSNIQIGAYAYNLAIGFISFSSFLIIKRIVK